MIRTITLVVALTMAGVVPARPQGPEATAV